MRLIGRLLIVLLAVAIPVSVAAHFKLLEPQSWLVENDLGDPQKMAPCGGTSANPGMPSNILTKIRGGTKLHLKVQETVFHPGHYRVALAMNSRAELPKDPDVTTRETARGPWSVSAVIQNPVQPPILADGLFQHTTPPTGPFETDIDIPNINCEKCTLQIIQFMAEHGLNKDGDFSYHHCADLQISADSSKPIDSRWMSLSGSRGAGK
jgi:hypothetical protein